MKQIILFLILSIMITACTSTNTKPITSFEECAAAGFAIMESYPRKCSDGKNTFTEIIELPNSGEIPESEVLQNEYTECKTERSKICTKEYKPVCAVNDNGLRCITSPCASTNLVTKSNSCTACSDETVLGYYENDCNQNTFAICDENINGFDTKKIAEENGWICVDTCPGNYDEYYTQIGAKMCIEHYGETEINAWQICTKSSENCNCVKAYETTSSDKISNPEFRCVPDKYAERLLFRAGMERIDESGSTSVAIA